MEITLINNSYFKNDVKVKTTKRTNTKKQHSFISVTRKGSTIILSRFLAESININEEKFVLVILRKTDDLDKGELFFSFKDKKDIPEEELLNNNLYKLKNYSKINENSDWRILNTKLNNFIFKFFNLNEEDREKKSFKIDVSLNYELINDYPCYKLIHKKKDL